MLDDGVRVTGASEKPGTRLSRRGLLRGSLVAGGTLLIGFGNAFPAECFQGGVADRGVAAKKLGVVDFSGEASVPMETALGDGLDGRMYTDLAKLTAGQGVTPTDTFYIRTRASERLQGEKSWKVRVSGLAEQPFELSIEGLNKKSRPLGRHLMECAGNARSVHFGLMSVADWAGVPLFEILDEAKARRKSTRVLISGFDSYPTPSASSVEGASWIFDWDQLKSAVAFLATEMNGQPLTRDHGAPVRLMVPGWYGCACIKWVNEITSLDDASEATSQMQEFATRTQQQGVPKLARDFKPAVMDPAAMPVRIEKWIEGGRIQYRVFGILWGGSTAVKALEIRFNPEEDYVAVEHFEQKNNDPWSFWTHTWTPRQRGTYMIRLRVKDPEVVARRMDAGYYLRAVEITEV
jgi:DMSO/TMAO reductase YedYZ molybdopterin-dependent catalytic subunit